MLGLIGSVVSSAANAHSQKKTNEANIKIAQMNNDWSAKMQQKQMDYNTAQWQRESQFAKEQADAANSFTEKMWNKTNEYNSAKNQASRLREAGLNPALVMSGQNAGSAQGASGAQAPTPSGNSIGLPSPSSVRLDPYRIDIGTFASQFSQRLIQKELQDEQVNLLKKEAQYYDARAIVELNKAWSETDNWRLRNKYQQIQNNWADAQFSSDVFAKIRQGWNLEANAQLQIKQAMMVDKDIAWYDTLANGNLSEQLSRISLNYANGSLSLRQAEESIEKTLNLLEDRIGKKMDNDIKAHTRDVTIQRAHQARNLYDLGFDAISGINRFGNDVKNGASDWFEQNIMKPSRRLWKDTRRYFGLNR